MKLTFFTELGESYAVEIDENMELENVMALLEAEVSQKSPPHPYTRWCGQVPPMSSFLRSVRTQLTF